jgi:hypothetical protein
VRCGSRNRTGARVCGRPSRIADRNTKARRDRLRGVAPRTCMRLRETSGGARKSSIVARLSPLMAARPMLKGRAALGAPHPIQADRRRSCRKMCVAIVQSEGFREPAIRNATFGFYAILPPADALHRDLGEKYHWILRWWGGSQGGAPATAMGTPLSARFQENSRSVNSWRSRCHWTRAVVQRL